MVANRIGRRAAVFRPFRVRSGFRPGPTLGPTSGPTLRPAVLLLAALLFPAVLPGVAQARPRHAGHRGGTDGVVRCVAASSRDHRAASHRGALPTDRAVFFARSGDRCFWHHGALGRG